MFDETWNIIITAGTQWDDIILKEIFFFRSNFNCVKQITNQNVTKV